MTHVVRYATESGTPVLVETGPQPLGDAFVEIDREQLQGITADRGATSQMVDIQRVMDKASRHPEARLGIAIAPVQTKAGMRFEEAVGVLRPIVESVAAQFSGLAHRPDKIEVEFGLKFGGEGGLPIVTKVSGEASLQVTLTWSASKDPGQG